MSVLRVLDMYGTTDPDYREGHPEARCFTCGTPLVDHQPLRYIWRAWYRRTVIIAAR